MKDLINTLKNYGAYSILNDIVKQGYCRRAKDIDRSKTVQIMVEHGIVESVMPTDFMLRFVHFSDDDAKQNFINEFYFFDNHGKRAVSISIVKMAKRKRKGGTGKNNARTLQ